MRSVGCFLAPLVLCIDTCAASLDKRKAVALQRMLHPASSFGSRLGNMHGRSSDAPQHLTLVRQVGHPMCSHWCLGNMRPAPSALPNPAPKRTCSVVWFASLLQESWQESIALIGHSLLAFQRRGRAAVLSASHHRVGIVSRLRPDSAVEPNATGFQVPGYRASQLRSPCKAG